MQCIPSIDFPETLNIKDTVNYKNYFKNQGNVSALRVEEFKRRCIAPHGNGEVVLKTRFGRITDTLA